MSMTTELIERLRQASFEIKEFYGEENEETKLLIESADTIQFLSEKLHVSQMEPCEDCISRQQALHTFGLSDKTRKYGGDHSGYDTIMLYEVQIALEELPPVQPAQKVIRCKDCKHFKGKVVCEWHAGFYPDAEYFCADAETKMEGGE